MIPRILHQMWKDAAVPPRFAAWRESWRRFHPDWEHRFWTDDSLDAFVRRRFPSLHDLYRAYPEGIMRADLARYLLLWHYGGLYADLDAECLASFEPVTGERRLVLAREPESHAAAARVGARYLPWVACNAVMASPPDHPFWPYLSALLRTTARARGVLDATGPFVLTRALLDFQPAETVRLLPPESFYPLDREGRGRDAPASLARPSLACHHWSGTWVQPPLRMRPWKRLRRRAKTRWKLARQERSTRFAKASAGIDRALLARRAPADGSLALLVPVRDAAATLPALLAALEGLALAGDRVTVTFLEGGSLDGSADLLRAWCEGPGGRRFRAAALHREAARYALEGPRWAAGLQRARRGGLAAARNELIDRGLGAADWALWVDADMVAFPPDVVQRLLDAGERLVTPHCVRTPGGPSFDLNTFLTDWSPPPEEWGSHLVDGLYQPPRGLGRLYLEDLRYLPKVRVDGLGATLLQVDGNLHRAGLRFPERPYRQLIESEALAALAADLGIAACGLPQLEVFHAEEA